MHWSLIKGLRSFESIEAFHGSNAMCASICCSFALLRLISLTVLILLCRFCPLHRSTESRAGSSIQSRTELGAPSTFKPACLLSRNRIALGHIPAQEGYSLCTEDTHAQDLQISSLQVRHLCNPPLHATYFVFSSLNSHKKNEVKVLLRQIRSETMHLVCPKKICLTTNRN